MMSRMDEVFSRIDGYRDDVIDIQTELTSRLALGPSNGGTGEHQKTAYVAQLLRDLKPDFLEEVKAPDERAFEGYRPNLLARWGDDPKVPTVWVLSHSDIVPPGNFSLWESDPYKVRVVGDRIIGRGVEDNQRGFVSSYLGLKSILESGETIPHSVGIAVVADEETGSAFGLQHVLTKRKDLFKKEDLIIVPDGGNEEGTMIEVAEKSMLWLKCVVSGKQCHASTPQKGRNSLVGAAELIMTLQDLETLFPIKDALFSPPQSTFATTKMEANVPNINTIPGKDVFYLDCRLLPRYQTEEVLSSCREMADRIENERGLSIDWETVQRQEAPQPTPPDSPVVRALTRAIKEVSGREAKPMGIGGGTVAAFFRKCGFPAAVWSTSADTAHQPNESCDISDILRDAKVFASVYLNG